MCALKRTTEEVAQYFKEQGCELLDEYWGCMEPMDYKCKCGKYGTTSWNNFTKGKRCGNCTKWGQAKKRSLAQVQSIFAAKGCEFLDNEFKGIHHKHKYKCVCGRIAEISFAAFHHQDQLCRECGIKKNTGSNNPGWKKDREKLRLDQLFRKKCYKALSASLKATGRVKVGRTSDMLGYTPKQLQEHVESHPNWAKVKDGKWHLDHIFPIAAFLDHGISDVSLINCLDNLQPVNQKQNNEKWAHYDKKEFVRWLKKMD